MSNVIDVKQLTGMFMAGAKNLEANREWINELNVFPVPDGDTGTNMTMTIMSAAKEVAALGEPEDMASLCKAMSSGSLRGARGNSGVILSQLLRGFGKVVRDHGEIDVPLAAEAFEKAVETAYKAVMKPKEGTILTVAKGAAVKARALADAGEEDFDKFLPEVIAYADEVLASTPDMLPVLKQAGVVDSGGQGLMQVLKGAYDAYRGVETDYDINAMQDTGDKAGTAVKEQTDQPPAEIKYGYCTEFIILLEKNFAANEEKEFKEYLESIGDSIVCVPSDEIVKIHVHTNNPGLAIQRGLLYGQLDSLKIDNMRLENQEVMERKKESAPEPVQEQAEEGPEKEVGFVAVAVGDGLTEIFRGLGVDYVISGGQTMNPSTEDILNAVAKVNAQTVFILPNNKNIIMSANQAAALTENKKVIVIPTTTIPQGITAVINYMPDVEAETSRESMTEEITNVKTIEVTYAVRDTMINDKEIRQGDMMAIGDQGILSVGKDYNDTALEALSMVVSDSTEIISIYYGADIHEQEAEALKKKIERKFPGCDIEVQFGGQPIYYYILSAE